MGRRPYTPLAKAIEAIGMNTAQFAIEVLGLKYATYSYRVRQGCLGLDDYHKIIVTTGRKFEDLFPNPYAPPPVMQIPASETIPRVVSRANDKKVFVAFPPAIPLPEPQKKEQKKGEVSASPASEFKPLVIFDGLPAIQDDPED